MDDLSAALLVKALDGLTLRSAVTAENVANAGTRGYRPLRVTFEQALAEAAPHGAAAVAQVTPRIEAAGQADALRLDLELATASSTSHRFAALAELLNRELQLRAIAIRGS